MARKKIHHKNYKNPPGRLHAYWVAFLIWFFPPYAWHNMWRHKKYHPWFTIVSFLNFFYIMIPLSIYMIYVYPVKAMAGSYQIISWQIAVALYVIAIMHIFYGVFLKKEIKSKKELPKNLLWPTISLFMFDYIVTLILTPIAIPILNNPLFDIIQASLNK